MPSAAVYRTTQPSLQQQIELLRAHLAILQEHKAPAQVLAVVEQAIQAAEEQLRRDQPRLSSA